MVKVQLSYNPYTVETKICLNGKPVEGGNSPLTYVSGKRLQEWMEPNPNGSWKGFFEELKRSSGEKQAEIEFVGTSSDFDDLEYAKDKFGNCFAEIRLIHKNKATAEDADPSQKMVKLQELYQKLQDGPIDEFKTEDIQKNFEAAINSDFRIVIVAPMSSGKSTLINAIIGRDMLPAINQATTAVITEIRDNDRLEDFLVTADDKYGKSVAKKEKASKELISKLNYAKDPADLEGKDALIRLIQLEGPIPNLPSDVLNTVFVDTPGGNNSQNNEHEKMMVEAIGDENKSLILYVFNGEQIEANDSNIILKKIADAMKNSTNGKQSRDRFLFVANRMDVYDVEKEPYEGVIKDKILPMLAEYEITEPNLFLASAQTAKLIRMVAGGEELSETEEEDLDKFVKRFNRSTRMLPKYASLNSADRDKLIADAEKYATAGKEAENIEEEKKYKYMAAEINSGIPAIEMAIKEYLQKYAIAIKIKTVHDTFMRKVIERNMKDKCQAEWAESKESFEAIKREIQEKLNEHDHSKKLQEFRGKVDAIKFDPEPVKEVREEVDGRLNKFVQKAADKVKLKEAEYILASFKRDFEKLGKEAQAELDNVLNNGVRKSCQGIVEEYKDYIKELDSEGAFRVGSYDMKQTEGFAAFNLDKAEDLIQDTSYVSKERVKVGTKEVEKKGFFAGIARFFGIGGYETVGVYENQNFVALKQLMRDKVASIMHSFDKEMDEIEKDTKKKVERLKETTMSKLEGLDKMIVDQMAQIDRMLTSQEELKAKVEENEKKAQWIQEFISEVDGLLKI